MQIILDNYTKDGELTIEKACRTCYSSFHRMNPPESTAALIKDVIQKGHFSVLEHATATFKICGISRACSHELVRHRLMSFSQESQRYVTFADKPETDQPGLKGKARKKTKDFTYYTPQDIAEAEDIYIPLGRDGHYSFDYYGFMEFCHKFYEFLLSKGIKPEDARYVLPNATCSDIVVSGNVRTWRHFLMLRCHPRSMTEIRQLAHKVKDKLKEIYPSCFFDFPEGVLTEDNFKDIIPT